MILDISFVISINAVVSFAVASVDFSSKRIKNDFQTFWCVVFFIRCNI